MTLHQLRIFICVAKYLNVSKAAGELRVSQPAVSQALRLLEEEFELKLYCKTNLGVRLTEEGLRFLENIEPILVRLDKLETDFKQGESKRAKPPLLLGAGHSAADSWLPALLAAFQKTRPNLEIVLFTDWSPAIEEAVIKGAQEIGVILNPSHRPELHYETFGKDAFVFVACQSHRLSTRKKVGLEDMAEESFVVSRGATDNMILSNLKEQGFVPNIVMRCETPASTRAAIRAGTGIGILMENSLEAWNRDLKVLHVPEIVEASFDTCVIYPRESELSTPALELLTFIRSWSTGKLSRRSLRAPARLKKPLQTTEGAVDEPLLSEKRDS